MPSMAVARMNDVADAARWRHRWLIEAFYDICFYPYSKSSTVQGNDATMVTILIMHWFTLEAQSQALRSRK